MKGGKIMRKVLAVAIGSLLLLSGCAVAPPEGENKTSSVASTQSEAAIESSVAKEIESNSSESLTREKQLSELEGQVTSTWVESELVGPTGLHSGIREEYNIWECSRIIENKDMEKLYYRFRVNLPKGWGTIMPEIISERSKIGEFGDVLLLTDDSTDEVFFPPISPGGGYVIDTSCWYESYGGFSRKIYSTYYYSYPGESYLYCYGIEVEPNVVITAWFVLEESLDEYNPELAHKTFDIIMASIVPAEAE